ncbi:MAG: FKBP-type peptidyl-prolyl cis-trans isomerase [Bacteroidales bacterium]
MVIDKNKVVALKYELRKDAADGEVVEVVEDNRPLQFIFGIGNMLEKFESNINGLKTGDNFDFNIKSSDAYGEHNPEMVVDVPKDVFIVNGKVDDSLLVINKIIPMRDQHGHHLNGKIINIGDKNVTMDFNHMLAGNDLFFKGQILEIREATENELSHGHIHEEGHGCGSGGCGSGCGCN